jgi:acyl-CoA thioester hydrolase
MFIAETKLRVRYAETDQMGFVYYGNYAMYYEVARVETMRQLGFSYKKLEDDGIIMPVLECKSKYLLPGKYDEELTIKIKIPEFPKVKILFEYEIFNESSQLINEGETTLFFSNKSTHKPCRVPTQLTDLIAPYFNEEK